MSQFIALANYFPNDLIRVEIRDGNGANMYTSVYLDIKSAERLKAEIEASLREYDDAQAEKQRRAEQYMEEA